MRELQTCEVVFLTDDGMWETELVEVPVDVLEKDSQDAFVEWVYSEDGEDFRGTWVQSVITVYIWQWQPGADDPRIEDDHV